MAKTVITHGVHTTGQDMPEVAADELNPRNSQGFFDIAVSAVFPTEGNMVGADVNNAAIANGGLGNISTENF